MKKRTINIGPLRGVSVRTRVRLATVTELIRNGEVMGTGIAVIKPGEEHTMDFKTGARLSGERAVEDFFEDIKMIGIGNGYPRGITRVLLLDQIRQDEREAKFQISSGLMG
jgi:hypothetical protein